MKRILIVALFSMAIVLGTISFAYSVEYEITQLTNNSLSDRDSVISDNGDIVWIAGSMGTGDIYRYDGTTKQITKLTTNNSNGFFSINSKGDIAFGNSQNAYLYKKSTGNTTNIISNNWGCVINDNCDIAWNYNNDIYLYRDSTGITTCLTNGSRNASSYSMNSSGNVVWNTTDIGNSSIYLYNGTTVQKISNNTGSNIYPLISDTNVVVWVEPNAGVYYYNGTTVSNIGPSVANKDLSKNGIAVWDGYNTDRTKWCLYRYDGYSRKVIYERNSTSERYFPKVNKRGDIVWQASNLTGGGSGIFLYNSFEDTVTQVTNNGSLLSINSGGDLTWTGSLSSYEVFLGHTNNIVPDPSPILALSNGRSVIDFGPQYGIWIYDNGAWSQLHAISPDSMVAAQLDGDAQGVEDLIIDFGPSYGIWIYYNNSNWSQLHNINPKTITVSDLDNNGLDEIIVDFGSTYGIWAYYNNSTWTQLHPLSADSITPAHENGDHILCIDFGSSYGIWNWHPPTGKWPNTWFQLHAVSPEIGVAADIDSDGNDEGIIDFGSTDGVWIYEPNGSTWSKLHTVSPKSITVGNIDSDPKKDLIIDFGPSYGIWVYANNSTWSQLHSASADSITTGDMNGNGEDEIIIDFGPAYGVWVRNDDGTWWQLHTVSP